MLNFITYIWNIVKRPKKKQQMRKLVYLFFITATIGIVACGDGKTEEEKAVQEVEAEATADAEADAMLEEMVDEGEMEEVNEADSTEVVEEAEEGHEGHTH